ncbi:MAG: aldehyde ferredoxin oxidoreductase family protein [bacterium]|nr:aldehyde ferredoxin oxidoreductase family protein [bacterium]
MYGYNGRILHVNLSTSQSSIETFDETFAQTYLGGNGFAVRLLYDHLAAGIDPLGPDNMLVFAVGPATDTLVPGATRCCVATKSPLTGLFCDSTFGGMFAVMEKRAGFEAISITGQASQPVYLLVNEAGAEIKPASDLWGQYTQQTNHAIQAREGKDVAVLSIGPAGENRVRYACAVHTWDKSRDGVAGRGGIGAVMGSKNLKAIAVTGSRKTTMADPQAGKALLKDTREDLKVGTAALKQYGTTILVNMVNKIGALGVRNLQTESYDKADAISGETFREAYFDKDTTCFKCPVACGKDFHVQDGEYAGTRWKMPEYETIFALGSMLDNSHKASIVKANELCDQLGMDTISMGVTLSFAFECYEKGLLTDEHTDQALTFGDYHMILDLIEATAYRRGLGDLLAEGSVRIADQLGGDAANYLYAVKGLEMPAHSARVLKGMSIGYATATRGGSHHDTRPTLQYGTDHDNTTVDGKPEFAIKSQHFTAVGDSLTQCRFVSERGFGSMLNEHYPRMINVVTGWDLSLHDVERIGERIWNLERAFNVREGVNRSQDVLPYRVMYEPVPDGLHQGMYCPPDELNAMLDAYYELRGWDANGVPTPEKLASLGLASLSRDIC